ncbi:PfkB family carbohydrate kinase [Euryarchaeota archaeon]|nr:PfkB family carbohydrate kinase [Euryarchaeota archaeon]MDA9156120.1 PfkB family carbohydrate kinase [Candidatus Poseidoniaceae archaeon]MDA8689592.1 PfkB family carbohydrate kinase [Euryarchaeota archaeon]MDA8700127.1 PfkB family carbohydrate kinase [Euryarchaeota archaeon]MDA8727852.1 PfkB family carbohydrate kinase [Euryarchaeota archaeon]
MDVLIVGSVAYDSVASPLGHVKDALGGSATYAGLACSFHSKRLSLNSVGLVGVVGEDFSEEDRLLLTNNGLDLTGIETAAGETFRWSGSYHGTMAEAQTHETHLNVFEHFEPKVPESHRTPQITFCANLHPALQASVLQQATPRRLSMLDSMNLWIEIAKDSLLDVMRRVDLIIINDGEVRMLAGDENLIRAARKVLSMVDAKTLVVKRGEHGVIAFHGEDIISLPAFPTELVVDPTGCGDTFAGSLAAHLASGEGELSRDELRKALVSATVSASFTLESFGTEALHSMSLEAFNQRLSDFEKMLN